MADIVDAKTRSRIMAGIRGTNTKPEMVIRRGLHALGFRYSLHSTKLPGKPDLVLPRYRAVIFVHGCFWHGHDCHLFRWPSTRQDFWRKKIEGNRARDVRSEQALAQAGWRVFQVWECALKGRGKLGLEQVVGFVANWLGSDKPMGEIRGTNGDNGSDRLA